MTRPLSRSSVYGPLISTADPSEHRRLFSSVFGMTELGSAAVPAETALPLFGTEVGELVVLQTPGVSSGVVVCRFASPADTVRSPDTRLHRDALKVIDFYAPDYEAAIARARGLGYDVIEAEASYDLPEGRFREAHLWGPDSVVTAFLGGPAGFFEDFAQVTDREVSEVQSISAPLSDAAPVVDFYARVFGWDVVYEYAIDDPSFGELIGADAAFVLRSQNVGPSTRQPYFGLIDYGLPADAGGSLVGRSVPPRRGVLGAVVLTEDLEGVRSAAGPDAAGETVTVELPGLGAARAATVTPPHRIPHLVIELLGAGGPK